MIGSTKGGGALVGRERAKPQLVECVRGSLLLEESVGNQVYWTSPRSLERFAVQAFIFFLCIFYDYVWHIPFFFERGACVDSVELRCLYSGASKPLHVR